MLIADLTKESAPRRHLIVGPNGLEPDGSCSQTPRGDCLRTLGFRHWIFGFVWNLGFGYWDLIS
jgi:hypothetical protein